MQEIRWDDSPDALTGWRSREIEALRARAQKRYADAHKPICSRCGKPGSDCRKREACNARRLKRSLRGCDHKSLEGLTLPSPPQAWIVARGYGLHERRVLPRADGRNRTRTRASRCATA